MNTLFSKLLRTCFLLSTLLLFVACSPSSPTGNVVQVDTIPQEQGGGKAASEQIPVLPTGPFCQEEKLSVNGRDASGQLFEYKNECIGRVWYHSYTCDGVQFKAHNQKCVNGCNLFGCEE